MSKTLRHDPSCFEFLVWSDPPARRSLTAPTARQQPGLTQALVEVANVGDSHIRLMLKDPANYHVDKSIVQMSLRAFYTILWNPANEMHNRVRRANTHARTCSRDRSTERGKQQVQSDRSSTAQVTPIPAFGKSWW